MILEVAVAVDVKNDFEIFKFITAVSVMFQIFWKLMRSQIPEDFAHSRILNNTLFLDVMP
jgi:hypothetical protein